MLTLEDLDFVLKNESPKKREWKKNKDGSDSIFFKENVTWGGLSEIGEDFYRDCDMLIKNIEENIRTTTDYREIEFLKDTHKNAIMIRDGIINRRIAKIVDQASLDATEWKCDYFHENLRMMTSVEREAYDSLVKALKKAMIMMRDQGWQTIRETTTTGQLEYV